MLPDFIQTALADPAVMPALIGAGSALIVALVTGWMGRGKFQREMLWDKRQAACNEILSHLYASLKIADGIWDGFAEDEHRFYGSDQLQTLNERYGDELTAAHVAFQANYLLLPSAFRRRYERMDRDRRYAWEYAGGPDAYLDPIAANERGHRDLFDLARAELGIAPWWSRLILRWRPAWSEFQGWLKRTRNRLKRWWRRSRRGDVDWGL